MYRTTAQLYDVIYAWKDYAAESEEIHRLIQSRCPGATTLLDVGCGTGRHLEELRRHYEVAGVDADPRMIAVAADRLPGVQLLAADMRTFRLDRRFDAVICLFSSIGYMRSGPDLDRAVATMAGHLADGGLLVVDGWIRPDAWRGDVTTHLETAEGPDLRVARATLATRSGDTTTLEMRHLVVHPASVEYLVDRHELTLFAEDQYMRALRRAGLDPEVTPSPMPDRDRYVAARS